MKDDEMELSYSEMTDNYYIVTRKKDLGGGMIEAITKYRVTNQIKSLLQVARKEVAEDYENKLVDDGEASFVLSIEDFLALRKKWTGE